MEWDEVIGQQAIKERLLSMYKENRMPHALMFTGGAGVGKLPVALWLATFLLCENKGENGEVCGHCPSCTMLKSYQHPDLHFSYPVVRPAGTPSEHKMSSDDLIKEWRELLGKSPYITMENWLEAMSITNQQAFIGVGESDSLIKKLSFKSSRGGYKISIIWLVERMNVDCVNKLLKLFEEPAQRTVFIMTCEEPNLLLDTIKSRVQRIELPPVDMESVKHALQERRGIDEQTAHYIARTAEGSWTKALRQLSASNEEREFLAIFIEVMRLAYARNIKEMKRWAEKIANLGREKQKRCLLYFSRLIRENFIYNFCKPELNYMSKDEEAFAKKFARFIHERNVIPISDLIDTTLRDVSGNANPKIVFFDFAIKMILYIKKA